MSERIAFRVFQRCYDNLYVIVNGQSESLFINGRKRFLFCVRFWLLESDSILRPQSNLGVRIIVRQRVMRYLEPVTSRTLDCGKCLRNAANRKLCDTQVNGAEFSVRVR